MATTNPFRDRIIARQTYSSREDVSVCQEESEASREEIKRFIGKIRWDE